MMHRLLAAISKFRSIFEEPDAGQVTSSDNIIIEPFNDSSDIIINAPAEEPFIVFPCVCKESVTLIESILPGQAAVVNCSNCDLSWTVYNPSLIIKQTKEVPEQVQEVWRKLSE